MTDRKRMPFIRCFTMLMMLLCVMGMMVVSATAAPGDGSKAQSAKLQTAGVTLDVCTALFDAGLIDVDGTVVGEADLAVTDLPADITPDVPALAGVNSGECGLVDGFPPVLGGDLTFAICDALDVNNNGDVDGTEAIEISIDLDGDGDVDADEPAFADDLCDAILAPGPSDDTAHADGTTDGTEAEPGSLVISNFACPEIEVPVARVSDRGVVNTSGDAPEEGCVATPADFQIFLNGDFNSDPIEVFINESGTVNGVPSTQDGVSHALFEPAFKVYFNIEIAPGDVTTVTVLNPTDDGDGATPNADGHDNGISAEGIDDGVANNAGGASTSDDNDEGDTSNVVSASNDDAEGSIIGLPSTGQGGDGRVNGSMIVLLFGTISMVALVGGFAWRQRRTC